MDLQLRFDAGSITGTGIDDVAPFVILGKYDTGSLECLWTKTYPGSHDVAYRGFREGKGIWGTWNIRLFNHGGFHIWPLGGGEEATETRTEAASGWVETPKEGILVGTPEATNKPETELARVWRSVIGLQPMDRRMKQPGSSSGT